MYALGGLRSSAPARSRAGTGRRSGPALAIRTAPPVHDFRLVDLVAPAVGRGETRRGTNRAIDVYATAAASADQMMVVVAHAIFEAGRGSGRLNAPQHAFGHQQAEGVVDRLQRNGADLGPDGFSHGVGRDVRLSRHGSQHGQSLGRDLNTKLTEEIGRA